MKVMVSSRMRYARKFSLTKYTQEVIRRLPKTWGEGNLHWIREELVDAGLFELYDDVKEDLPFDTAVSYGKDVEINGWVDADQSGDCLTICSYAKVLVFISLAPIVWY